MGAGVTQEEIIKLAREASFVWEDLGLLDRLAFYKFANLVAVAEREACAKECEEVDANPHVVLHHAVVCAAAIRARGQA